METTDIFNELAVAAAAELLASNETTMEMKEPPGHFLTRGEVPKNAIQIATFDLEEHGSTVTFTVYMQNGNEH